MPRHIDLGHYLDSKLPAVIYDLSDFLPAVITALRLIGMIIPKMISSAHGADLMKPWVTLALNTPSLVIRYMPVKPIQFELCRHADHLLQLVCREIMPRTVNMERTVGISRTIFHLHTGKLIPVYYSQLIKRRSGIEESCPPAARKRYPLRCDLYPVFLLPKFRTELFFHQSILRGKSIHKYNLLWSWQHIIFLLLWH